MEATTFRNPLTPPPGSWGRSGLLLALVARRRRSAEIVREGIVAWIWMSGGRTKALVTEPVGTKFSTRFSCLVGGFRMSLLSAFFVREISFALCCCPTIGAVWSPSPLGESPPAFPP